MKAVPRVAIASAWACVASVALYAVLRAIQYFLFPDPNPATVVWSLHAGYFWRLVIVAYGGGMAGLVAFLVTGRHADLAVRALVPALVGAGVLITAQGILLP